MSKPYLIRIIAIQEMLDKPLLDDSPEELAQKASKLLYKLWVTYKDNLDFIKELQLLRRNHPMVIRELENLIQRSQKIRNDDMPMNPKDIFISYAHVDEKFKDELVKMLSPLQDQGVLRIWQDREIEPGEEWYQAIQNSMNACDIALLLISSDFLNSRFIKSIEVPNLLRRRREEGLRAVPIIIRSCLWQSVPVLKDLQALPKDGKPISSFEDRDQVWTDIGKAIEDLTK